MLQKENTVYKLVQYCTKLFSICTSAHKYSDTDILIQLMISAQLNDGLLTRFVLLEYNAAYIGTLVPQFRRRLLVFNFQDTAALSASYLAICHVVTAQGHVSHDALFSGTNNTVLLQRHYHHDRLTQSLIRRKGLCYRQSLCYTVTVTAALPAN